MVAISCILNTHTHIHTYTVLHITMSSFSWQPQADLTEIKNLFLLLTLLATLATTSLAYCPGHYSYETCFQLYSALETALLNHTSVRAQNLYNLREEYFPSSHPPPLYGHVSYTILLKADPTSKNITLCDGAQPDTAIKNLNGSKHLFLWSDSGLLAKLEPYILSFYQLEILSYIFGAVGIIDYRFYPYPPKPSYVVLNLTLQLETMPCTPSKDQLLITLKDLTSWVGEARA